MIRSIRKNRAICSFLALAGAALLTFSNSSTFALRVESTTQGTGLEELEREFDRAPSRLPNAGLEEDGDGLDRFGEGRKRFLGQLGALSIKLTQIDQKLESLQQGIQVVAPALEKPDRDLLLLLFQGVFPYKLPVDWHGRLRSPEEPLFLFFTELTETLPKIPDRLRVLREVAMGKRPLPMGHPITAEWLYYWPGTPADWASPEQKVHLEECPSCFALWLHLMMRSEANALEEQLISFTEFSERVEQELSALSKEKILQSYQAHVESLKDYGRRWANQEGHVPWSPDGKEQTYIREVDRAWIKIQRLVDETPAAQLQQWIVRVYQEHMREFQRLVEELRPKIAAALEPLPELLKVIGPIHEQQLIAQMTVEDAVRIHKADGKADGVWHVVSAEAVKKYPGLTALEVPNLILDDEFGEAIVRLMEEPQPIGRIHFYYVARQELDRFLLFMEMEPPPLVLQEGWLIEHLLDEPYPSFPDFLKQILSPHLPEPKAASEGQGIDWNRLASALELLAGA